MKPISLGVRSSKSRLAVALIVRNESELLKGALQSVLSVADELLVGDTGSTDSTVEIARTFTPSVYPIPWTEDFAAARNRLAEHATAEWVLFLDADESLSEASIPRLSAIIAGEGPSVYTIIQRHYTDDPQITGWTPLSGSDVPFPRSLSIPSGYFDTEMTRLYSRHRSLRWTGLVHETLERSAAQAGIPVQSSGILLHHFGKLRQEEELKAKDARYLRLTLRALTEDEENSKLWIEAGQALGALSQFEQARLAFSRALSIEGSSVEAEAGLAVSLLNLERYQEAEVAFRSLLEKSPRDLTCRIHLTTTLLYQKKWDGLMTSLKELMAEAPSHPVPPINLALLSSELGDWTTAREALQIAHSLRPKDPFLNSALRKASRKLGLT